MSQTETLRAVPRGQIENPAVVAFLNGEESPMAPSISEAIKDPTMPSASRSPKTKAEDPAPPAKQAEVAAKPAQKAPAAQTKVTPKFLRADATKVIPLEWGMEFDGVEYTEVTVRVITGDDIEKVQGLAEEHGGNAALISVIANIPVEVAGFLAADDLQNILQEARPFMPRSMRKGMEQLAELETGDTPPAAIGTNTQPS